MADIMLGRLLIDELCSLVVECKKNSRQQQELTVSNLSTSSRKPPWNTRSSVEQDDDEGWESPPWEPKTCGFGELVHRTFHGYNSPATEALAYSDLSRRL
ncbi:hypothetical protein AXF42_Ash016115 [Apostasia shenzhenica]|uniref:Uncharacterized protein n=1 Tax=Apostasia shenzhenica TaxID=1088818 RepID=A0A2I0B3F4_9ASPA|nr:hypothetical protein AXF42_Ash016115 [Apostasia shenzhenica]